MSNLLNKFYIAKHKAIKSSILKINLVADLIRGLDVNEARLQLKFSKKKVAYDIKKVLDSAIANAENSYNIYSKDLYVFSIFVGKSYVLKRLSPRARGRSVKICKPYSYIKIILQKK